MIVHKIKSAVSVFRQFWGILSGKFRLQFILISLAIVAGAMFETLGVSALLPFIQALLNPDELMQNRYVQPFVSFFNIRNTGAFVMLVSLGVVFLYFFKNLYQVLSNYWQGKFRTNLQGYVSSTLLKSYLHRPYSFFISNNSSALLRNVMGDANGIMTCVISMFSVITSGFIISFMFIFLFITNFTLALGLLLSALLVLIIPVFVLGPPLRDAGDNLRAMDGVCYKYCSQAFQGIKEIIVSHKESYFADEYRKAYKKKNVYDVKVCVLGRLSANLIETVCITALILIVAVSVVSGRTVSDAMVAELGAFAMAAFKLLIAFSGLSTSFNDFIVQYAALSSAYENLSGVSQLPAEHAAEAVSFDSSVEFRGISFAYETNSAHEILHNVNACIKKGDVIGIKGASGAGKTTFVDILLGLLQPSGGAILLDGTALTEDNMQSWLKKLSYVPQTAYLLDDSIRANVAFGVPEPEIDDAQVQAVLKEAMLSDYVDALPDKERTVVGERGIQMSGGQRQRLSIARALYTNPEVIIFDEATSALDEETEKEIMESIDRLIGQKTLIIIAHRLSTLRKCNKIFEVKDGTVQVSENP